MSLPSLRSTMSSKYSFAQLVGTAQQRARQALAACFERDHVLAAGHHADINFEEDARGQS